MSLQMAYSFLLGLRESNATKMTNLIFNYIIFITITAFQMNLPRETQRKQSNFYDLPAVWVQGSWTPRAPSDLPWPGFGERSPPSRHEVYSGLAFFSLIREGAGRTSGMMAVNFRLFTTQDWSLTSEWTHLNREIARPQLHPWVFFTGPAFLQPFALNLTALSCSCPSPFTTLFLLLLFISLTPGHAISSVVTFKEMPSAKCPVSHRYSSNGAFIKHIIQPMFVVHVRQMDAFGVFKGSCRRCGMESGAYAPAPLLRRPAYVVF